MNRFLTSETPSILPFVPQNSLFVEILRSIMVSAHVFIQRWYRFHLQIVYGLRRDDDELQRLAERS